MRDVEDSPDMVGDSLERYRDFAYRLERGRSYVRSRRVRRREARHVPTDLDCEIFDADTAAAAELVLLLVARARSLVLSVDRNSL